MKFSVGLEKMERDKLKQVDRERERQEKEVFEARMKLREKDAMEILKSTVKEQQKSKFVSFFDLKCTKFTLQQKCRDCASNCFYPQQSLGE